MVTGNPESGSPARRRILAETREPRRCDLAKHDLETAVNEPHAVPVERLPDVVQEAREGDILVRSLLDQEAMHGEYVLLVGCWQPAERFQRSLPYAACMCERIIRGAPVRGEGDRLGNAIPTPAYGAMRCCLDHARMLLTSVVNESRIGSIMPPTIDPPIEPPMKKSRKSSMNP